MNMGGKFMELKSLGILLILMGMAIGLAPQPAMAYIGPGTGLSAIGAFLAIIVAIIIAILGFLWYPLRRLIRHLKKVRKDGESKT